MNRRVYFPLTCALPLLAVSSVGAQQPVTLATRFLRATTDTIAVTVEMPGRVIPFATAYRSVRRLRFHDLDAVEMTYQWRGNDGSSTTDTLWLRADDLGPLENHRHNGIQDGVTAFQKTSAATRFVLKGKTERYADTTITDRLYASGELEDLIRLAPLADGYRGAYTLYYGPPGRLARPVSFSVVRSETVKARNGQSVECWVVDASLSEGLNTFFVSKSDRRVVRLVNHEDPRAAFVFTR